MRRITGILLLLLVAWLIRLLDKPLGALPPVGRLIDPVHGFWANAEPENKNFNISGHFQGLNQNTTVWLDEFMIPHIHAGNDHDLYFMQGYLHAMFRLWQMDMETRAAGGRVSEILGKNEKYQHFDRLQRRKGMVYAAENSLKAMEAEPRTKLIMDAYTEGINFYISQLNYKDYPLEYKLMDFAPEPWTNLKSMLLLKYMADDLTGETDDFAFTYLRDKLSPADFALLYPERISGSNQVIPPGTAFEKPSMAIPTRPNDSVFPHYTAGEFSDLTPSGTGSNNWAVGPSKTLNGAAILCNDPHLMLNLPSLWYEVQLQTPEMNVYGASLPGAPGVVIGFNDSLSWGFTNNYRDVKDFFAIKEVPGHPDQYLLNGKTMDYSTRVEKIVIKNADPLFDTVKYAVQGPVMYDAAFPAPGGLKQPLALCWMAHRPTNELLAVYLMNKAKSYDDFVSAIMHYECPAQNMVYADRRGNIALWGQGQFINKWKEQGKFIMNGEDTATMWHELIPMRENPHVLNPPQGYVASANQCVTDSTYPYWYNGIFLELRAWRINQLLGFMKLGEVKDMFSMQQDTHSLLADGALKVLIPGLNTSQLSSAQRSYLDSLEKWDKNMVAHSITPTLYQLWWTHFRKDLWSYLGDIPDKLYPVDETTLALLIKDHQDTTTTLQDGKIKLHERILLMANQSFTEMTKDFDSLPANKRQWYSYKNTSATHLSKLPAFSFSNLDIGGWGNTINAAKGDHGPSWRMVVEMSKEINAYGIYPGGQSGNPGSQYYASFLGDWAAGKYNKLLFYSNTDNNSNNTVKYTWTLQP